MREAEGERSRRRAQLSLVIFYRDGIRVVPLIEGEPLIIGRSYPADVEVRDNTLSRRHARIEITKGQVWIEDLGSTNGTTVDGVKVARSLVGPGAEIAFGASLGSIKPYGAFESGENDLDSHDRFLRELDAEVRRSLSFGRGLALLMVRSGRQHESLLSRWFPEVKGKLRPFDRVALYSSTMIEILLPEASRDDVERLAGDIVEGSSSAELRCGYGLLSPRAGSSDELFEQVRTAVQRAHSKRPLVPAKSLTVRHVPMASERGGTAPVAQSPAMKKVFTLVPRLASSSIPVLIRGETGAGKEVIAGAIHGGGKRREKPLIPVNCGAIPPQLVEATLFGHIKGAFTGASQQSQGVFESADGGTVLLDEIGELPASAQAALLRVLETKRITRVGATKEIDIDVRILAATHRDLDEMCEEGSFRSDLLYRLDGMSIVIPPLRKRLEDLLPLIERFIDMANRANDCAVKAIGDDAMELLRSYRWPGNVRELRNVIERAVVIAQDEVIEVQDLPARVRDLRPKQVVPDELEVSPAAERPLGKIELRDEVRRFERDLILRALREAEWDRKGAAEVLGLPLRTLSHKMKSHEIKRVFSVDN